MTPNLRRALLLLVLVASPALLTAQVGTLTGRVIDRLTREGISDARLEV